MKKCFLLILLLPLVLSCTGYLNKEVAQKRVSYPRNNVRGYVMTMEELEEFALNLPSMFSNNPKTKTEEGQKWIKDITPLKKTCWKREATIEGTVDMTDYIYLVNYGDNKGFCVVSSNNAMEQVLAYSDSGNLSDTTSFPGIHIFMESLGNHVANNGQPCNFYIDTGDTVYFYQFYQVRYEDLGSFDVGVSHFSNWGQGSPYNSVCSQAVGYTCPTGCVATAIGQIMSYHQHPDSVFSYPTNQALTLNWGSFPCMFTENDDYVPVSTLLYRIGLAVQMQYSANGSGANSSNVPAALQSFGYTSSSYQVYNQDSIITSLSQGCPVYIRGVSQELGGHAWVIENGHQAAFTTYYDYKVYDQYGGYHGIYSEDAGTSIGSVMWYYNWGWNGQYNGYYTAGTYNSNTGNFDNSIRIIPNIRPNSNYTN